MVVGLAEVVALLLDYATGRTSDWVRLVLYLPWTAFVSVAVWRCAWNTRHKGWGYAARVVVVVGVVQTIAALGVAMSDLMG